MFRNRTTRTRDLTARWHGTAHPMSLGLGLIVLGLGAAMVAVLGPLFLGEIEYHASAGAIDQIRGGDAAAFVLVAPLSIFAGILTLRERMAGPVLGLGPAAYALYTYVQLALGGDFRRYDGNSELFFPLFVGLFILAALIVFQSWSVVKPLDLPPTSRRMDLGLGVFFFVVAAFLLGGLHLPGLVDVFSGEPTSTEYLADPGVFWLVKFMDLGIVVPALLAVGVGIIRNVPWAHKARYAAVGWFALLGSSVAGMALVMQASGDPAASIVNTIAFSVFALIAVIVAVVVYRPLFDRSFR